MERRTIPICHSDGRIEDAQMEIPSSPPWTLIFKGGGHTFACTGNDLFNSLAQLREELSKVGAVLLCTGARRDVFPSGMSRSMSGGRKAYVTRFGHRPSGADVVDIFDVARDNIATVQEQEAFHREWMDSLRGKS